MQLTYAHCTHAEPHRPDCAPYTRYVWRTVELTAWQIPACKMLGETEQTYRVDLDGRPAGYGDTLEDALQEASYNLMDRSRTAAGFDFTPADWSKKP